MADSILTPTDTSARELILSREFAAPRNLVWQAWTDPQHVGQWWGPDGFTVTTHEIDFRPGGVWRLIMHGPDWTDWDNHMAFIEVVPQERLFYNHGSAADDPGTFQVTVTFADSAGGTTVTMRTLMPTVEASEQAKAFGAVELGQQTLGKLALDLATR
jgi:uncharacterized protein YndB with AHSA1/START domain